MDLSAYPGTVIDHPLYQDNLVIDQRNYTTTIYRIQKKKRGVIIIFLIPILAFAILHMHQLKKKKKRNHDKS